MEMVEIKCENCGKVIYIDKKFVRDKMFCTLGCLDTDKRRQNCMYV